MAFGLLLLEDSTGERVDALANEHRNDSESITVAILAEWIAGRGRHPVSWRTLIEVLNDIGHRVLAREIGAVKVQTVHSKVQSSELKLLLSQHDSISHTLYGEINNYVTRFTKGEHPPHSP